MNPTTPTPDPCAPVSMAFANPQNMHFQDGYWMRTDPDKPCSIEVRVPTGLGLPGWAFPRKQEAGMPVSPTRPTETLQEAVHRVAWAAEIDQDRQLPGLRDTLEWLEAAGLITVPRRTFQVTMPAPVKALEWHFGPTPENGDHARMWCYGCGGEVFAIEEGYICSKCDAQEVPYE